MSTETQPGGPGAQSAAESDRIAATRKNNTRGKVLSASMVGTTIEFFDFYAYATASSLVFPALFFPNQTSTTQMLSSFAIFGVAFVARPVGSIIFGHFGDRVGRKKTLIASLLIMGIGTFLIGLLPTASTPGWVVLAPLFLVLLRFSQGVGLGGEWSGAALLATENAPPGKRAIWGTFPQLGAPVGFILANLLFVGLSTWISPEAFLSWGWRIPFLLSALLVAVGLYVRLTLMETPAFQLVEARQQISRAPIGRVFTGSWLPLLLGTFIMLATYVIFYFMTAFTLTYGTSPATVGQAEAAAEAAGKPFDPAGFVAGLGYAKNEFLTYLIIGVVFFGIFTVVSGPLAERLGRVVNALAESSVTHFKVEVNGEIADKDVSVLKLSALKGLFKDVVSDQVSYVNAPLLAEERGIGVELVTDPYCESFRNVTRLTATTGDGQRITVAGTVTGPKLVQKLTEVDGYDLEIELTDNLLIFRYEDRPGIIGQLGLALGANEINIAGMQVSPSAEGSEALSVMAVDTAVPEEVVRAVAGAVNASAFSAVSLEED